MFTKPSRRELLQVGGITTLGLGLPMLSSSCVRAANEPTSGRAKSCIFIFQYGGLSQLDSWDVKPNAPAEVRGPYKPIATSVPGFQVGELMPRLATLAHKYSVIRSMSHGVPIHDIANKMLLAGRPNPANDDPSFGSVIAKLKPTRASVPPYVWLQKFGGGAAPPDHTYLTGGFLGAQFAPMLVGVGHDDNLANPNYKIRIFDSDSAITPQRLGERRALLDRLDHHNGNGHHAKAFDVLTNSATQHAFELDREPTAVRDRYGRNPLGQNLLLARRLIESGVRLVSVVAWTGLKPSEKFLSVETWDMHGNAGVPIFGDGWNGLGYALPRCDQGVATLLEDLDTRGMLDSTLVVLVGEFGRTPKISKGASAIGRDHWPQCYSAMLAGGGVRGGVVYGSSDQTAAYVRDKPVSLDDFSATIYHALGIAPETRLAPDGFTRPASMGQPVTALFHG